MAKAPHEKILELTAAFDMADRNTPRDELGRATYKMSNAGMPRTPAQMASVKKAAAKSAQVRKLAAATPKPAAGRAPGFAAPGIATGSLSLAAPPLKGGLLRK